MLIIWTCPCLCAYYLAFYQFQSWLAIVATIQLVSKPSVAGDLSQRLQVYTKGYHDASQGAKEAGFLGSNVSTICRSAGTRALCSKLSLGLQSCSVSLALHPNDLGFGLGCLGL